MGETKDLSNFERGMIVDARRAGARISETTSLLGFYHLIISQGFKNSNSKQTNKNQTIKTVMVENGW